MEEKNNLKISLQELRKIINLNKIDWNNQFYTNCYAYALGLDIRESRIIENAFVPGIISNSEKNIIARNFTYEELITNLYNDLDFLEINFREIKPNEIISSDEWKIALFTQPDKVDLQDFHFLRLCKDEIWHHKKGWCNYPTMYDDNDEIITDPQNCFLQNYKYTI